MNIEKDDDFYSSGWLAKDSTEIEVDFNNPKPIEIVEFWESPEDILDVTVLLDE